MSVSIVYIGSSVTNENEKKMLSLSFLKNIIKNYYKIVPIGYIYLNKKENNFVLP